MDTTDQNISFDEKGFVIIVKLFTKKFYRTGKQETLKLRTRNNTK